MGLNMFKLEENPQNSITYHYLHEKLSHSQTYTKSYGYNTVQSLTIIFPSNNFAVSPILTHTHTQNHIVAKHPTIPIISQIIP